MMLTLLVRESQYRESGSGGKGLVNIALVAVEED